ncbi:hypothetical protein CC78DRAFT_544912 [Lojkania enalia]|uniref:Polynucleotide 5'-hydroxyl-kinase GRC3 n=1 Tax=Lojkania enalia TaxID=147567 RepID=A0A9P4KCG5_9PLEO|nr:hypothetical protein CC78DRAFT_544912 [Didymosphaeria enalia]
MEGTNPGARPISAIAAAKLRARELTDQVSQVDGAQNEAPSSYSEATASDYEEESDEDVTEVFTNFQLCNWRYENTNVISESGDELTISLNKNKTASFVGCYDFVVLKGAINVNGANIARNPGKSETPNVHRAYAPSTHPIMTIRGLDHENWIHLLSCKEPVPFVNISPLFTNIWASNSGANSAKSFSFIPQTTQDPLSRPLTPLLTPSAWLACTEETATTSLKVLVIGAPITGKSSFARRLLNRYITGFGKNSKPRDGVYYLDLDPCNSEYVLHGQVSLALVREVNLGPTFTHLSAVPSKEVKNKLIRAHSFPIKTMDDYREYFYSCASDLYQTYLNHHYRNSSIPLVVNTPGWLFSSEFPLLQRIISLVKPQRLIHLDNLHAPYDAQPSILETLTTIAAHQNISYNQIPAQGPLALSMRSETELRSMQMQAYFHTTGSTKSERRTPTYNLKPLSHMVPWELCYEGTSTAYQSFVGFMILGEQVAPSALLGFLNGSLVHIVSSSSVDIQNSIQWTKASRIPYFEEDKKSGIVQPLDPQTSSVVCTALVRSFDPPHRTVQIIMPKTHEHLMYTLKPEHTVFVAGCCENPTWAFTEDAYYAESEGKGHDVLPPWVETAEKIGEMGYLNTIRRVRKFHQ